MKPAQPTDLPAPTRPISEWPARRVAGAFEVRNGTVLHVTSADIAIGRAYVPPPAPLGSEAERIQAALLKHSAQSMWDDERSPWAWLLYGVSLVGAVLITHLFARCSA